MREKVLRDCRWLACGLLLAAACPLGAQEQPTPEDMQDLLAAQAEAGLDVNPELETVTLPLPVPSDSRWCSTISTRWELAAGKGPRQVALFQVRGPGLDLGIRTKARGGQREFGGTVQARFRGWEIRGGGVGLVAGYGLLMQGPGRRASLSPGRVWQKPAYRLKGWSGSPHQRSVLGGALCWQGPGVSVAALRGTSDAAGKPGQTSAFLVRLGQGDNFLATGVMSRTELTGTTVFGGWQRGPGQAGFEMVAWRPRESERWAKIWLWSTRWHLARNLMLTGKWSGSDGNKGPVSGSRPGLLDNWSGAGWAWGLQYRLAGSWRVQTLLAQNQGSPSTGQDRRLRGSRRALEIKGVPWSGWHLRGRLQTHHSETLAWSPDYPWLPASLIGWRDRTGATITLRSAGPSARWTFALKSLRRRRKESAGRRTLASIKYRHTFTHSSGFCSWQWAWGEAVDLVGAIQPLPSLVLPRHWGRWSSELLMGGETHGKTLSVQAAVSHRLADMGPNPAAENSYWLGALARW